MTVYYEVNIFDLLTAFPSLMGATRKTALKLLLPLGVEDLTIVNGDGENIVILEFYSEETKLLFILGNL